MRPRGVKERERGENKGEGHTQTEHLCRKLRGLGTVFERGKKKSDVRKKMTGVITRPEATDKKSC